MAGKVWLVGAGPSDIGLMTVKGKEVLENAQVVVYDALVGKGILSTIPENAETINVGKRSGNHTMKQEEISKLLAEKALEGKHVVRLKGGDPFLFGRGGEEIEALLEAGVTYEVVPGVTSAISVPAYNGIPVTHREYSSSLHIITAHKKKNEPLDIDFLSLVKLKGTYVFLMGVSALEDICNGLMEAGMAGETEAAILEQGTTARQRKVIATVATLKREAENACIQSPAIIVVGKVCGFSEKFSWYEKVELFGKRILVTRPRKLISKMAESLREKGAEVLEVPAVSIVPIKENKKLKESLKNLSNYTVLAFTSPSGVQVFFDKLKEEKTDIRKLAHLKIAAIGKGTVISIGQEIQEGNIDYVAFTSASTVKSFVEMVGQIPYEKVKAVCIGKKTAEAAKQYGMEIFVSQEATIDSMVEKTALSHVQAGADMVAPSDMMDGRIGTIRTTLDNNGFVETPIMSYAVKYASSFYGPFREAAGSAPSFGDRKSYQMDFHNVKEGLKEAFLDIEEGADIIMVKPALSYLDVIRRVSEEITLPVAAYSVSGEYAMVKAAGKLGYIEEDKIICEMAVSTYRAGAGIYLTYFAKELAGFIQEGRIG